MSDKSTNKSDILSLIAVAIFTVVICPAVRAQTLTLDTPSDLEHARVKADKAWKAWEAQGHIEPKLLNMPADKALVEIRKDGRLAEEYLSARQIQVKLLSDDFRRRATALESGAAEKPDLAKLQKSEEQNLAALIEGAEKTNAEMAKTDKDSDPGQREARRQAAAKEAEYYKELADDARKRMAVLQASAKSDEQYTENEHALIDTLKRLSTTLDEQGTAIAQEREDWQLYHKHLEELVVSRSHGSAKTALADRGDAPADVAKSN
jgi:hypothetical protein